MKTPGHKIIIAATALLALNTMPDAAMAKATHHRAAGAAHRVAATNVSGTYVTGTAALSDRLRVSQLKNGNIWFYLNAYYPYHDSTGELTCNMGGAEGNVPLKDNTAVWKYSDGPGKLIFKFSNKQCTITQDGEDFDCGFGHNVNASGSYRKISSRVIPLKRRGASSG